MGRESWGHFVALFIPRDDALPPRQAILEVESHDEATRTLNGMGDERLEALFRESRTKDTS